jgi:hypothetical protein
MTEPADVASDVRRRNPTEAAVSLLSGIPSDQLDQYGGVKS